MDTCPVRALVRLRPPSTYMRASPLLPQSRLICYCYGVSRSIYATELLLSQRTRQFTFMSLEDVEMKQSEEDKKQEQPEETKEIKETTPQLTPASEIVANLGLIDRAVSTLEPRFTHRVLRSLTSLRKKLSSKVLEDAIKQSYLAGWDTKKLSIRRRLT
jgi:hypothetical protein